MNIPRLREVAKAIGQKPSRFDMSTWFASKKTGEGLSPISCTNGHNPVKHCGTTACMAGWAMALHPTEARRLMRENGENEWATGRELLGLSYEESSRLFFTSHWPMDYYSAFHRADTAREQAKVAKERIEHFIATGK